MSLISSTGDMLNTDFILRSRLEWLMHRMSAMHSTLKLSSPTLSSIIFMTLFINSSSAFVMCMLSMLKKGFLENDSRSRRLLSSSERMSWRKNFTEKGFSIYASAPSCSPFILLSRSFLAVMNTIGMCDRLMSALTALHRLKPSISGIITSDTIRSMWLPASFSRASLPLRAVSIVNDMLACSARNSRMLSLSSTISTVYPPVFSFAWLVSSSSR